MNASPCRMTLLLAMAAALGLAACKTVPVPVAEVGEPVKSGPVHRGLHQRADAPAGAIRLSLVATSELRGQLFPIENLTHERPPRRFEVGGAVTAAGYLAALRARDDEAVVLFDTGDFAQGTLLASRFEGAPVVDVMNQMGYAAATLGNHDLVFGPVGEHVYIAQGFEDDQHGALKQLLERARFPFVWANVSDTAFGSALAWTNVQPMVMIERKGVKLAVIGVASEALHTQTLKVNCSGLGFHAMQPAVLEQAKQARELGAQLVVVLAHAEGRCQEAGGQLSCDGELFNLLDGLPAGLVDVVFAGAGEPLAVYADETAVAKGCPRGVGLARVDVFVDPGTKQLVREATTIHPPVTTCVDLFADTNDCEGFLLTGNSPRIDQRKPARYEGRQVAPDTRILRPLKDFEADLLITAEEELAIAAAPITREGTSETAIGNLIANVLLAEVDGAAVALVNAGGIRADFDAGPITYKELFDVYPFHDVPVRIDVTGRELRQILQVAVSGVAGIMQVGGVTMTLDCTQDTAAARPENRKRINELRDSRGEPIADDEIYILATNEYLANGGDQMWPLARISSDRKKTQVMLPIREAIAQYLRRQDRPLNSDEAPLVNPDKPRIRFVAGECAAAERVTAERRLCE